MSNTNKKMDFSQPGFQQLPGTVITYIRGLEKRVGEQGDVIDILRVAFHENKLKMTETDRNDLADKIVANHHADRARSFGEVMQVLQDFMVE